MKVPICKLCQSPHWTYEPHESTSTLETVRGLGAGVLRNSVTKPAINKEERLTDAINSERPMPNNSAPGAETSSKQLASGEVGERGVSPQTPNRRSRESYNTYMRGYMRAYRERSK